ncbi:MAG: hypothetical protein ACKVS6_12715 [Planctomycetota bacterium]
MNPIKSLAFAAILIIFPSCVFSAANRATARDVDKTPGEPGIPESKFVTVDFDANGMSEVLYQTPPDRAFWIRDFIVNVPCSVYAEVAGNSMLILPWWALQYSPIGDGAMKLHAPLNAGFKLAPGASLKIKRIHSNPPAASQAEVFFAGELIRM